MLHRLLSWLRNYPDDAPLVIEARSLPIDRVRNALALCASNMDDDMKVISPPDKPPKNGRKGRAGRPPIGERAMTPAERAIKRLDKIKPNRKPRRRRVTGNPGEDDDE